MSLIDVIFKKNALPKVPASLKELVGEIRGIKTAIADLWRSMTNAEGNINRLDEAVEADENTLGDIVKHKVYLTGSTLSQSMISKENTIYVVKDDLTLSEDITVPANCVLEFEGGSIRCINGGLTVYNSIVNLNNCKLIIAKPIILDCAKLYGTGGVIEAINGYSYPYMCHSYQKDTIDGVIFDGNGNDTTAIYVDSTSSVYNDSYKPEIKNVTIKNLSYTEKASIVGISSMIVSTSSAHNLSTGDIVEIKDVIGGYSQKNGTIVSTHSVYNDIFIVEVLTSTTIKLHTRTISYFDVHDTDYSPYESGGKITKIGVGIFLGGYSSNELEYKIHLNTIFIDNVYVGIVCRTGHDSFNNITISNTAGNSIDVSFGNGSIFDGLNIENTIKIRLSHGVFINNVQAHLIERTLFDIVGQNQLGYAGGEVENLKITNVDAVFDVNNPEASELSCPCIDISTRGTTISNVQVNCHVAYTFLKVFGAVYESAINNCDFVDGACNFIDGYIDRSVIDSIYFSQLLSEYAAEGQMQLWLSNVSSLVKETKLKIVNTNFNVSSSKTNNKGTIFENISGTLDLLNIYEAIIVNCHSIINNGIKNNNIFLNKTNKVRNLSSSYSSSIKRELSLSQGDSAATKTIPVCNFIGTANFKSVGIHIDGHYVDYNKIASYKIDIYISLDRNSTLNVKGKIETNDLSGTLDLSISALYNNQTIQIPLNATEASISIDNFSENDLLELYFDSLVACNFMEMSAICNPNNVKLIY